MLGDEDAVLVLRGELASGVELHAQRRYVGAELDDGRRELGTFMSHAEDRIDHVALVTVRIAEMLAQLRDVVELVARQIVTYPVARVLAEPQVAGAGIDRAADAVANAH